MPSAAEMSSTAASSTERLRCTSPAKSTCPGVSIRFSCTPLCISVVEEERTEMPLRRSISSQSVWAVPLSTLPGARSTPDRYSICSVRVVLPASTWATIPRLMMGAGRFSAAIDNNSFREKTSLDTIIPFFREFRHIYFPYTAKNTHKTASAVKETRDLRKSGGLMRKSPFHLAVLLV